ncbi:MAG: hypothetical protein WCO54_02660 [Bacteroidota bacterium]
MRLKLRTKIFWGYVIGVTLFSCVITLFITHRVYHKKEVLKQNVRYTLQVIDKNCGNLKRQNYCVIEYKSENHIVNLSKEDCALINIGDSLQFIYDKEYGLFFKDLDDLKDEYYGLIGFTILGIILLISCFFELNI